MTPMLAMKPSTLRSLSPAVVTLLNACPAVLAGGAAACAWAAARTESASAQSQSTASVDVASVTNRCSFMARPAAHRSVRWRFISTRYTLGPTRRQSMRTGLGGWAGCAVGFVVALLVAGPAFAQFGHPLKGTWSGEWGPTKEKQTRVLLEFHWDGKEITGRINPGPKAVA